MNLFINAVSTNSSILLFSLDKNIIARKDFNLAGNESSKLIDLLDEFLATNDLSYNDLENIVVVNGPGSFTGIRTIVLLVNTINFVINKNITAINYFDLYKNYPMVKKSSKRDCFIKKDSLAKIEVISNEDLEEYLLKNNIKTIYGEINENKNLEVLDIIDYIDIINNIKFDNKKSIEALYLKKPNIS